MGNTFWPSAVVGSVLLDADREERVALGGSSLSFSFCLGLSVRASLSEGGAGGGMVDDSALDELAREEPAVVTVVLLDSWSDVTTRVFKCGGRPTKGGLGGSLAKNGSSVVGVLGVGGVWREAGAVDDVGVSSFGSLFSAVLGSCSSASSSGRS